MDVYNATREKNDFKTKSKKSMWILKSLTGKTVNMNVINIDIVDSSERVKSLSSQDVEHYYKTFIEKSAEIIQQFGGYVLKNVGDCVIGFFPTGNYINENHDSVVTCGLNAIDMVKNMNADFQEIGLPPINCRVSADFGEAKVVQLQSQCDYSALDLFGNALNKPTNILHHAKPDQMVVGGDLFANFMSDFREGIKKKLIRIHSDNFGFDFKLIHRFDIRGHQNYPVFLVERS
jgi:class 3 adenylate cyclase